MCRRERGRGNEKGREGINVIDKERLKRRGKDRDKGCERRRRCEKGREGVDVEDGMLEGGGERGR